MINRIPCKCLLISSLSGLTRLDSSYAAPDKLDIKRHKNGIIYISYHCVTYGTSIKAKKQIQVLPYIIIMFF